MTNSDISLPRLVLDTNVVMDLFHFRAPALAQLMKAIETGTVISLANERTLNELQRVTGYPQFCLNEEGRANLMAHYCARLTRIPVTPSGATLPPLPLCRDPDDQIFLELAQIGHADLLISRDNLVLKLAKARKRPCPFKILSPEQAIQFLFSTDCCNCNQDDPPSLSSLSAAKYQP